MKKLLLTLLIITGCFPSNSHYEVAVTYTDGGTEFVKMECCYPPTLTDRSCVWCSCNGYERCDVRSIKVRQYLPKN